MNNKNFYLLYSEDKAILNKEIDNLKKKLLINEDSLKIAYFYDNDGEEYIFDSRITREDFSMDSLLKEYLLKSTMEDVSIDSAHNFHVYVQYTVNEKIQYYSYEV